MDHRSENQKIDMMAKAERLEVELGRVPTVVDEYHALDPDDAAAVERSLLRKIDLRILPLVVIIYIFNYLDRNSITQARLYGLQKDTDVKGAVYQTAISIFSAGYIAMQLPSTLLMTKLRPSLFLPICIIAWAVVSGCTAATNSAAGLLTVRFFLGIIEAPFFPGAMYFLSCWYTPRELGVRMALLICGLLLSNSFAGLISAGILSGMAGVGHLHAWRWLFILEGTATVLLGLVAMLILPDYPGTTKWLSDKEKIVAQARLSKAAGTTEALGDMETPFLKAVVWAAKDYRVWIFACLQMATSACISYSHFFPTLIQGLGFKDNKTVLLLTSPPYLFAFCWAISFAFHADRVQKRSPHAGISYLMTICATIVMIALPFRYQWVRYALTFPITAGVFGVYSTIYAWLSSTTTVPPVKRAAAMGIANSMSNLAALYANYFWLDEYGPTYKVSWGILLAFQGLGLTCVVALRLLLKRSNTKFDELAARVGGEDNMEFARLDAEQQNAVARGFRYIT
ncbi:putative transporter [Cyphellophora attinorum]|uniref:Putative transporter n=1 Tax=Cyphellophora attinorum TaxID=1664694 RepID=A0A0N1H8P5_9EURO|nr:putative transporter [Phialophora attinorum]KPI39766.1 putative transporter [Phialophora attinorum]